MTNEATLSISKEDMMKIIELTKHEPMVLDFSTLEQAAAPPKEKPAQTKETGPEGHEMGIQYKKEKNTAKWY